ncbi:MAG: pyridoxal phosphate-dependent aminotransferase [Bacteroidaceae bacterium]|nr:pyridoxal phosphate-dependent aminotransferase [Bacteroidaceae bacterium]
MKYDFDKIINRRSTNCVKWDELEDADVIPMWVADMDFETAPCILQALQERMKHGCFGYTLVPESYYEATIQWFSRRHGWLIDRKSFIYTSGVVPAISAIIKAMAIAGDKVLIQTPVYNCFFSSIRNNGCEIVENPLRREGTTYRVDWEDFEAKCSDPMVKIFLLCNPHNPAGRVWTREELQRMGEICRRNNVFVISDEIHCEFVKPDARPYIPYASISEEFAQHSAVCVSPSKAFNIAGLQIANIIVPHQEIRQRVDKAININEVCDVNPFGVIALQAAYTDEGEEWLNELNEYIYGNYVMAKEMLQSALPHCPVTTLEGTYLLWLDIRATGRTSDEVANHLLRHAKVYVNPGTMYGQTAGEGFIRINLATRLNLVEEGIRRLISGISSI